MNVMKLFQHMLRVFVLFAALMVWQAKTADAHGLENHIAPSASYSSSDNTPATEKQVAKSLEIQVARQQQEKGCDGKCCMNSMCCSPAAIPSQPVLPYGEMTASYVALPLRSLPQGPPHSLLRPPKLSA